VKRCRICQALSHLRHVYTSTRLSYPAASEKHRLPNTYPGSFSSIQQLHKQRAEEEEEERRRRGGGEDERRSGRSVG
jgi:hypothetical protein